MVRFAPFIALVACKAEPSVPIDTAPPTPPTEQPPPTAPPCPDPDPPFGFGALGEPLYATPPTAVRTRTYVGRVTIPSETQLDLSQLFLHDELALVSDLVEEDGNRYAVYEVTADCTFCDHASLRIGSVSSDLILTAPTVLEGEPVTANFSLESTAWMALGLSAADGNPAIATPIAYAERPDLNPYLADMVASLLDEVVLRGTTGVNLHGQPDNGSEVLFAVDHTLGNTSIPVPAMSAVPWLLPVAQAGAGEQLVTWGPGGRSSGLTAVDGRFLVDLPLDGAAADYAFRFLAPDGTQSRASTIRYPPDVGTGRLDVRILDFADAPELEVVGQPGTWTVVRSADVAPLICRAATDGRTRMPLLPGNELEVVSVDTTTLEVHGHTICTVSGGLSCR